MKWIVNWERYTLEEQDVYLWKIHSKEFRSRTEANRFIQRIRDNVLVGRIWIR